MNQKSILKYLLVVVLGGIILALSVPLGKLPVLGHFFNPFTGYVQNACLEQTSDEIKIKLPNLKEIVEVHYDSIGIPHVFASNDEDLYFIQGFIVAKDRLWQMEMQGRSGMGELSEVAGEVAFENDRLMKRLGLGEAALQLIAQSKKDGTYNTILQYTAGVNAYINSLEIKDYPLEYKLMNFKPRPFKPEYVAVLLKVMALRLTAMESDIQNTNFVNTFGRKNFDLLFPNYYQEQAPIIPTGTHFEKHVSSVTDTNFEISPKKYAHKVLEQLDRNLGSNNWAVSPSHSMSGHAMLCNDPHLKIHLPSIWYEMHLISNSQNVYGVTMPGAPGIIIGFNQDIAWGVTNAGRDVRNWYEVKFTDNTKNYIKIDNSQEKVHIEISKIYVKNKGWVFDTIRTTSFGRIVYDSSFYKSSDNINLALNWTNYLPSNELKTFLALNKAKNQKDYLKALDYFYCPGQNFVFASVSGDIAIKQQGLFPFTSLDKDKFVLDGTISSNKMNQFIPFQDNPYSLNPSKGYLYSANQHPTDPSYPYYYSSGDFEAYRNRRIEQKLASKALLSIEDMKALQCDNYSLMAAEFLPLFLKNIDSNESIYKELKSWNYNFDESSQEAVFFETWIHQYEEMVWDELENQKVDMDFPKTIILYQLTLKDPLNSFFDIVSTPKREQSSDIVKLSFEKTKKELEKQKNKSWWEYKDTEIPHLANIPALGRYHIKTGGNKHIVNATWKNWAPSWRMIVELIKNRPTAYVNFPGGISGNPASKFYDNFINSWAKYKYRKVTLSFKPSEINISKSYYFEKK